SHCSEQLLMKLNGRPNQTPPPTLKLSILTTNCLPSAPNPQSPPPNPPAASPPTAPATCWTQPPPTLTYRHLTVSHCRQPQASFPRPAIPMIVRVCWASGREVTRPPSTPSCLRRTSHTPPRSSLPSLHGQIMISAPLPTPNRP